LLISTAVELKALLKTYGGLQRESRRFFEFIRILFKTNKSFLQNFWNFSIPFMYELKNGHMKLTFMNDIFSPSHLLIVFNGHHHLVGLNKSDG
jgi:hypothetical protein